MAELEGLAWRFVHGLLTDPDRLRRGLDAMVEEKRRALRGDPDKVARIWLERSRTWTASSPVPKTSL